MNIHELCPVELPAGIEFTADVFIEENALRHLPAMIEKHLGSDVLIVADPDTWQAFSNVYDTSSLNHDQLLLQHHPHADTEQIKTVRENITNHSGLVAIGSGSINDICKQAAFEENLPCICVGTALSMNGYTSGIAAIMMDGLKTTQPSRPPKAVILDTRVTSHAPLKLTQAGLGDLLSKQVSQADFWLSHQFEGSGYSERPGQIVDHALNKTITNAPGLLTQEHNAYEALAEALILSGVSMVAAGSSAPASGGEHLISHLWDMQAPIKSKKLQLHGAQVGIATCISAALYQHILTVNNPDFPELNSWQDEAARIKQDHGPLADIVLPQARQKHAKAHERQQFLKTEWPALLQQLTAFDLPTPVDIQSILASISAPRTLSSLGFSKEDGLHALRTARDIRNRLTVLDLAYDLGIFPDAVESVLQQSQTLG